MADNVLVNAGEDLVATDEVVDSTLGTVQVQFVKLMDGTLDGSTKALVSARGLAVLDLAAVSALENIARRLESIELLLIKIAG